jgi:hypothetical protein
MSHHSRSRLADGPRRTSIAAIDHDLLQEKASALGRMGRRLEATLTALADFDAASPPPPPAVAEPYAREVLVAAAAEALWALVVQREACGFFNGRAVLDDYRVPADVHRRSGIGPPTRPRLRRPRG